VNNKKILKEGDLVLGGNATVKEVLYVRPITRSGGTSSGYSDLAVLLKASCVSLGDELYCSNIQIKINSPCAISNLVYTFTNGIILDVDVIKKARP